MNAQTIKFMHFSRVRQMNCNPEEEKINSYPWFDWLRFILASIVVLSHADFQFAPFLTGKLAVSVFFALSGWLIGGILLRTEPYELPRFFLIDRQGFGYPIFLQSLFYIASPPYEKGWIFFG